METTTGRTYQHPSLNGPVEPINRQFYKTQRWNVFQDTNIERGEKFDNRVDADPSDHWHNELEERECSRNKVHLPGFHIRLVEAVDQGHGECVHGKPETKENAVQNQKTVQLHIVVNIM